VSSLLKWRKALPLGGCIDVYVGMNYMACNINAEISGGAAPDVHIYPVATALLIHEQSDNQLRHDSYHDEKLDWP
jgi:hypothetical protein